jgi:putative transposase
VPREAHNRPVIIFVTTCTAKRRQILASASAHEAIVTAWSAASTWLVGRYVITPDHIHLFSGALDALLEISSDAHHGRA